MTSSKQKTNFFRRLTVGQTFLTKCLEYPAESIRKQWGINMQYNNLKHHRLTCACKLSMPLMCSVYLQRISFFSQWENNERGRHNGYEPSGSKLRISGTLHNHSISSLVKKGLWYLPHRAVVLYV